MSSSASLLLPSPSLEGRCSLDLLSPRLSSQSGGFEFIDCLSPLAAGAEQLKPSNVYAVGGSKGVEKGASSDGPPLARLRGAGQLAAAGKPSAASVLSDLKVQRINNGGPEGVKGLASKLIADHQLDDTFYIVDLANVVRLFKSRLRPA